MTGNSAETDVCLSRDWMATLSDACNGYERVLILVSAGGRERGTLDAAEQALANVETTVLPPAPVNPSVERLVDMYGHMDLQDFQAVVAIGGGSVIDSAKAISVARSSVSAAEFETRLMNGSLFSEVCEFDVVAVPTTAGSGSEVTPFATIWDKRNMLKYSISGNCLQPKRAILDPTLLGSLRGDALLHPSLDAISHAIESLWSRKATNQSRLHAATALTLLSDAIGTCTTENPDFESLLLGSLYAGLAIAQSRTAISHSISYPLSLRFGVPHGLACSFTLQAVHDLLLSRMGPYCRELNHIDEALQAVEYLHLSERIQSFVPHSKAKNLVHEMKTPGRANNCLLAFRTQDIHHVLSKSFS